MASEDIAVERFKEYLRIKTVHVSEKHVQCVA